MSNLTRCQNGHMFSVRLGGTICPYCGIETVTEEKEDVKRRTGKDGKLEPLKPDEKVCGWLVCVEGIRAGMSYAIRNGKNFIGRGDNMDIQIMGDDKIDLEKHAIIIYDKKMKLFTLLSGQGSGMTYYENAAVYEPTGISSYDKIELGDSLFLFVEFVGDQFNWEEGITR